MNFVINFLTEKMNGILPTFWSFNRIKSTLPTFSSALFIEFYWFPVHKWGGLKRGLHFKPVATLGREK